MDSEKITAFVQEHWNIILIIAGIVLMAGAALNWNWLCDPTGAPQSHRYGRNARRVIFFLGGLVLVVAGVWSILLAGW